MVAWLGHENIVRMLLDTQEIAVENAHMALQVAYGAGTLAP
jgi:hypothetical protein